jgi:hypothetical protein
MSGRSDDLNTLEHLLRSIGDDLDVPPSPDIRASVRERLTGLSASAVVSSEGDGQVEGWTQATEHTSAQGQSTTSTSEKSLRRQLLEMAAAVLVVAIFTGLLAMVLRDQASRDEGMVPGTDDPTQEAATNEPTEGPESNDEVRFDAFLAEATPVENLHRAAPPYPTPETCRVTEMAGPYQRGNPDELASGFWWIGSGLYAAHIDTVFYEGSNRLYIQSESAVYVDEDLIAAGRRLDADSAAEPYLWVQHAAGQGTTRASLRLPEPGCWEIELVSSDGDLLQATIFAYPAFERSISAANKLIVTLGSTGDLDHSDDLTNIAVGVALNHPDFPELEAITLEQALGLFWLEDSAGEIYPVDLARTLEVSGLDHSDADREVPTVDDDVPLSLTIVFTVLDDADDLDLIIKMPEDHPDPSMPDVYRVGLNVLRERSSDAIITTETPQPIPTPTPIPAAQLSPTVDLTIDIPDDQMLALVAQRWVDDRRVMSVFDLDGNVLWEFDQIPNIEVDGFPSTIVADVSPDGRYVGYQHDYDEDRSDIFVMDAADGEPRQLTTTGDNYRPVWSPDGEQIAFLSDRAHGDDRHQYHRAELFLMGRDGSNQRQLSETPYGAGQIKWSHDGSMIAFASPGFHSAHLIDEDDPPEFPFQLFVVEVASGAQRELSGATIEHLAGFGLSAQPWLTDNSALLVERYSQVYLAGVDGSGIERVDSIPTGEETHQRWSTASPDGRRVAFNWTLDDGDSPIGVLNLENGEVNALSEELGNASHRGWSPDGYYLAALKRGEPPEDFPDARSYSDLWTVSTEDGLTQLVAPGVTGLDVRWLVVPRQ